MQKLFTALIILCWYSAFPSDKLLVAEAFRTHEVIKIDGVINEHSWKQAPEINGFQQSRPLYDVRPSQFTAVHILYDDKAIYIAAILYDTSPDSILKQLGRRDEDDLNADDFYIKIDPYLNNQDAYQFGVNAAGVQFDSRFSDYTYDAVWNSSVKITDEGWLVEMEIPYAAIRFPEALTQQWGLQITRSIRRNREFDQWALTPLTAPNPQIYWGVLNNLEKIESPLRLSFTPYVASTVTRQPITTEDNKTTYSNSLEYSAGADIKYGIDDRFTLDMILLPDFGQVQSDKKVKNLSYREVVFDENRAFFKEGVELFGKDNLFYSRRIGKKPSGYNDIYNNLQPGETVVKNPSQVKLLNAFKISGRTNNGLGIGFFNAITNQTYAEVNDSTDHIHKVLTEPLTNFNIIVFDQQLKNNSSFYLLNTHTNRDKGYNDANVTDAGFVLSNKQNTLALYGSGAISQIFSEEGASSSLVNTIGYKYAVGVEKQGGKLQYGIGREEVNNEFNTSDLGYYIIPGYVQHSAHVNFAQYKIWKVIRESFHNLNINIESNYATSDLRFSRFHYNSFLNLLSFNAVYFGGNVSPLKVYDYRESRSDGRKYRPYKYYVLFAGFSSDYRKKIAIDAELTSAQLMEKYYDFFYQGNISFRFRINDHLFIKTFSQYTNDPNSIGYAYTDQPSNKSILGLRELITYENSLSANYMFKNDMSLSIVGRHYWNTGDYNSYFNLLDNGELETRPEIDDINNFSSNFFNIDMVFEWRFAPGSFLNLTYKNSIETDGELFTTNFNENVSNVFASPTTNSFSVKILYFLDYLFLKKITDKKPKQ